MIGSADLAFYHCFPRRVARISASPDCLMDYSPEREIDVGLATLELIFEFGLVLASEPLRLNPPDPGQGSTSSNSSPHVEECIVRQRRICFTLGSHDDLARRRCVTNELASHFDLFGRFAIGIRPEVGRKLGLLPVHYFYRSTSGRDTEGALGALSDLLTAYLLEVREVLTFLAYSERERKMRADGGVAALPELERNYERDGLIPQLAQPEYREKILSRISNASIDELGFVRDLLNFDHHHIGQMADTISMILATYQTVDSASFDARFLYYFQQEWRLLSTLNSEALIFELSWSDHPDEEVRALIRDLNERIRDIAIAAGSEEVQLTDAMLLHGYSSPLHHFREAICAIVCPDETQAEVRQLTEQYGLEDIVILPTA